MSITNGESGLSVRTELNTSLAFTQAITATPAELNILGGVTVTFTKINYLTDVTSNIQAQLDLKAASSLLTTEITAAKARANHTGTQLASTVSDFNAAALLAAPAETITTIGTLINSAGSITITDNDQFAVREADSTGLLSKVSWIGVKTAMAAELTTFNNLTATTDNFIVSVSSAWASRTPAQVRTTLGLVIGTNVQAFNSNLSTLAGLTATTGNLIMSVAGAWASQTATQVKTTLLLSAVENTALSTWAGTTNITTLGTIGTGTWNATAISIAKGGSGLTGRTAGSIVVTNSVNTVTEIAPGGGESIRRNAGNTAWEVFTPGAGGAGDVVGPASATDNAVVRYDSTTGKLIQNSTVIIADTTGNISGLQQITLSGATSGTVAIAVPATIGTPYTFTLPDNDGTVDFVLRTDGAGVTSWVAQSGGGGTTFADDVFDVHDNADVSKIMVWSLGGATAAKTLTLVSSHTDNRTITWFDASDTVVGRATTDTLTNKTLTTPVIGSTATAAGQIGYDTTQGLLTQYATLSGIGKVGKTLVAGVGTETHINDATSDKDFTSVYTFPANAIYTNKAYRIVLLIEWVTGSSTVTFSPYLKLGATKVSSTTPIDPTNSLTGICFAFEYVVMGRAVAGAAANVTTAMVGTRTNSNNNLVNQPVALATNGTLDVIPGITFSGTGSTESAELQGWYIEEIN